MMKTKRDMKKAGTRLHLCFSFHFSYAKSVLSLTPPQKKKECVV